MADEGNRFYQGILRGGTYLFAALCFFLIFLYAVTASSDRIDAELILTIVIAVMLLTFMIYSGQSLGTLNQRLVKMAARQKRSYGCLLRVAYYIFSALAFFLIFILSVAVSPKRIDAQLILTMIVGILLLTLMISSSQIMRTLHRHIDEIAEKNTE